MTHAHIVVLHN